MEGAVGFTQAEAAELRAGDNCCVLLLKSRPELVGRLAMVVAPLSAASGRVGVQVEGEPKAMALRPEALEGSGLPEGVRRYILPTVEAKAASSAALSAAPSKKARPGTAAKKLRKAPKTKKEPEGSGASGRKPKQQKKKPAVTSSELFARVREVVRTGDVATMSKRGVRERLAGEFGRELVARNKAAINRTIEEEAARLPAAAAAAAAAAATEPPTKTLKAVAREEDDDDGDDDLRLSRSEDE